MIINEELRLSVLLNQIAHDTADYNDKGKLMNELDNQCGELSRRVEYLQIQLELVQQLMNGSNIAECLLRYRTTLMQCFEEQKQIIHGFIKERTGYWDNNDVYHALTTKKDREQYMVLVDIRLLDEIIPFLNFSPIDGNYPELLKSIQNAIEANTKKATDIFEEKIKVNERHQDIILDIGMKRWAIVHRMVDLDPFLQACVSGDTTQLSKLVASQSTSTALVRLFVPASFALFQIQEAVMEGQQDRYYGLHLVVRYGHIAAARLLLQARYPVNQRTMEGTSALQIACKIGDKAMVALLLEQPDTKIDQKGPAGRTALHYAAYNGHVAIVNMLLERGASALCADEHGQTPLHDATRRIIDWSAGFTLSVDTALQQQEKIVELLMNASKRKGELQKLLACTNLAQETAEQSALFMQQPTLHVLLTDNKLDLNDAEKNLFQQASSIHQCRVLFNEILANNLQRLTPLLGAETEIDLATLHDHYMPTSGTMQLTNELAERYEHITALRSTFRPPKFRT